MINIFLSLFLLKAFSPTTSPLKVLVKNVQVGKGSIVVEIYDNQQDFLKKSLISKTVKADSAEFAFYFELPVGVYAAASYQDLNNNRTLDKGLFNIPKEPYGLSNNYRPKFSAPRFNDCKFTISQPTVVMLTLK